MIRKNQPMLPDSEYNSVRQPYTNIACQILLSSQADIYSGNLKKKRKRISSYRDYYAVLHKGCVYLYKNGKSAKPEKSFSLYGYQTAKVASEIQEQPYAFKVVRKTDYMLFAVNSPRELTNWIKSFTAEISNANEVIYSSKIQERPLPSDWYEDIRDDRLCQDFNQIRPELAVGNSTSTNLSRCGIATQSTQPDGENKKVPPPLPPRRGLKVRSAPHEHTTPDVSIAYAVRLAKEEPRPKSDKTGFGNKRFLNDTEVNGFDQSFTPSKADMKYVFDQVEYRKEGHERAVRKTDIGQAYLDVTDEGYEEMLYKRRNATKVSIHGNQYDYAYACTGMSALLTSDSDEDTSYDSESDNIFMERNSSIERSCSSQNLIPGQLRPHDRHSLSIYHRCLQEGFESKKKIRIFVIGKQKSGKSCFVRRLLKEHLTDVTTTNGIVFHDLKCRANADDRKWLFDPDRTYEDYIYARLLRGCIENYKPPHQTTDQAGNIEKTSTSGINIKNLEKNPHRRFDNTEDIYEESVYAADLLSDFNKVVDTQLEQGDIASVEILDVDGDEENYNNHISFLGHEAIYVLIVNVKEIIKDVETNVVKCGLKFWLDAVRYHCKIKNSCGKETFEPPIMIFGTHKDEVEDSSEECLACLESCVNTVVTNNDMQQHIRKLSVVSNTKDHDDIFDDIRRDIIDVAKTTSIWNKQIPMRWIHLEVKLHKEFKSGNPFVSKRNVKEFASTLYVPIVDDNEIEDFLNHHHDIGNLIYDKDLPDIIILDLQWLTDAVKCVLSADKFRKSSRSQKEWQEIRQNGYFPHKMIDEIFKNQSASIRKNKEQIIDIMEKFNLIVRAKPRSEKSEDKVDYYLPGMIKTIAVNKIEEVFYRCKSKSSCLCLEFEFLPPGLFSQLMASCIRNFAIAKGPHPTANGKQQAFYRDIGIFNIEDTGCEKLLIAHYKNVIQVQIWKWGENEKRSYNDIKEFIVESIKQLTNERKSMVISYKLKVKCKYTDYETLDGMVDWKVIKPHSQYFCEEHGAPHDADEVYYDWNGHTELKEITEEQFNATKMAIVIVDILADVLFDLCLQDIGSLKLRNLCDITYLYAQLRKDNKHIPTKGTWGGNWNDFPSSAVNIGDDIERIRLARNDMQHLSSFVIDNQTFFQKHNMLRKLLCRMEEHNKKGTSYSDRLKAIAQRKLTLKDWETYKTKIVFEFPRIELKPSFEVKEGDGCTLDCKIVIPLPVGASVYWVKEGDQQETIIGVNESSKDKYRGGNLKYPSLNILSTTKVDEGHYSCRIKYPENSAEGGDDFIEWPTTFLHVHS